MKARKVFLIIAVLVPGILAVGTLNGSAEEKLPADANTSLKEMPVLAGDVWQKMTHDEKVAFIWGMGHMLSIERNMIAKHPEVKKTGFTCKMAEGLAGISMNDIIDDIDKYYRENPDDLQAPVIEVIWDDIAKPRIKPDVMDK